MDYAIHEKVIGHGMGYRVTVCRMGDECGRIEEGWEVVVEPYRDHEQKCHTGRVEEEIEFV